MLNSAPACPPLSKSQKTTLKAIKAQARAQIRPEAEKAREFYIAEKIQDYEARGMSTEEAQQIVGLLCDGVLAAEFALPFDDAALAGKTIAEVLDDPDRYVNQSLADPIEPEAGRCKAKLLKRRDGRLIVHSFLHGGRIFELRKRGRLFVNKADLPATVDEMVKLLSGAEKLFDRLGPVKLVENEGTTSIESLTANGIVIAVHELAQPYYVKVVKGNPVETAMTLPDRAAKMYLDKKREWKLRPLAGITSAPLLDDDGTIRFSDGYDTATGLWCSGMPEVIVSERPTMEEAKAALKTLRWSHRSFAFADAETCDDPDGEFTTPVVDISKPPGNDESAFLAMLVGVVARSSLLTAPGLLLNAPAGSGSGVGKGKLFRCMIKIASGRDPDVVTLGHDDAEFDKRLVANVTRAIPAMMFDNINERGLKSDTLASILTERPSSVRVLGRTDMVTINSSAVIALSGNGLTVTEDLLRRFIQVKMDAHIEEPGSRRFDRDILEFTAACRGDLLTQVLTIWRWGRQNEEEIQKGRPLGNFEKWSSWCRDPLLALGCRDPVARIAEMRAADPARNRMLEFCETWYDHYGTKEMHLSDIEREVQFIIDPNMSRQGFEAFVSNHIGSVAGPYTMKAGQHAKRRDEKKQVYGRKAARYYVTKLEDDK